MRNRQANRKKDTGKIKFAVVGLGHIAQTAVLPAFLHARSHVELAALVSGDQKKLGKLSRKYKVKNLYTYDEFDACLESGQIDAVYIALPNSLHADFTVRALRRGIHVLCEKPLALSEADCRRMVEASQESGAKLMTAYRLHFDEANLKAIRMAREKLGNLRYFSSTFSFQVRDRDNIRLDAKEGGNPVWDLGIYCINAARYFFRDEPEFVTALGANGGEARFRETQEMTSVLMKFPGERLANFVCSFGAGDSAAYDVVGTKGRLHMEAAYEYVLPHEMTITVNEKSKKMRFKKVDQFAPELIYFADCIGKGRTPEPSGLEGWADVRIIRAIEQSMRTGRTVKLPTTPRELERKARPVIGQWIERPPVKKAPPLVRASSPSGD